jgi:hypothetical protein
VTLGGVNRTVLVQGVMYRRAPTSSPTQEVSEDMTNAPTPFMAPILLLAH